MTSAASNQPPQILPLPDSEQLSSELTQPTTTARTQNSAIGFRTKRLGTKSIGRSLFLAVITGATFGFGIMTFLFYQQSEQQVSSEIQNSLATEVTRIEGKLGPVRQSMLNLGGAVQMLQSQGIQDPEVYKQLAFDFFVNRPQISMGTGFGQASRAIVPSRQWYFPYFYVDQGSPDQVGQALPAPNQDTIYADLFKEDNYPTRDYYRLPAQLQTEMWTEPYDWYGISMTTFATPIFNAQKQLIGVTAMHVNVNALSQEISQSVMESAGFFVLLSEQGKVLSYPPQPEKAVKRVSYNTVPLLKDNWSEISTGKKQGLLRTSGNFIAYQRIPSNKWLMVAIVPENVVLGQVLGVAVLGAGVAGLLLAFVVFWFVRRLNRRLEPILEECNKLAATDAITLAQLQQEDEIGRLSLSLANLLQKLGIKEENLRQEALRSQQLALEQQDLANQVQRESAALEIEVGHLLDVVSAVEEGDLTIQAQVSERATGLVADTFNRLIEELGQTLGQVLQAAQQVSQGSATLEALAETVATNAEQQAKGVAQTLKLTEQVENSAQTAALQLDRSNQSLRDVQEAVAQGQGAITAMTTGITVLQEGTDRIVQRMKTLGEFVGLADQFVQDQSQIASLTQVLSLNATLVASRAAEQRDPRQFAVVAREFETIAAQVSSLAQQTNDGLVSLQQRTSQIHNVVAAIDTEIQTLGGLVSGFTDGVGQSQQVFGNVEVATTEMLRSGAAVSQSSMQISDATRSTAGAMREIANLAQRTAELTQDARSQSEQMESLSNRLLSSIQVFHLPESILQQIATPAIDLSQSDEPTIDVESVTAEAVAEFEVPKIFAEAELTAASVL